MIDVPMVVIFYVCHDLCHVGCAHMAGHQDNKILCFVLWGDGTGFSPALPTVCSLSLPFLFSWFLHFIPLVLVILGKRPRSIPILVLSLHWNNYTNINLISIGVKCIVHHNNDIAPNRVLGAHFCWLVKDDLCAIILWLEHFSCCVCSSSKIHLVLVLVWFCNIYGCLVCALGCPSHKVTIGHHRF